MMKLTLQEVTAIVMLAVGISFALMGFWVPPRGSIHDSILWVFAQCLIYTGSVLGVAVYIRRMERHLFGQQPSKAIEAASRN
ncbi:MAG: hypothetical protein HUK09_03205 [Bacteroidaceae bacterium]|nr:hypothetical protein [Bacteroidaceae bacterium]